MKNKIVMAVTAGFCIVTITAIIFPLPQTQALHTGFRFEFGFAIGEEFTCECSFFNKVYRPYQPGLPRPLPPAPGNSSFPAGSLVTVPFLSFLQEVLGINITDFIATEYRESPIQEDEYVIGLTHSPPLGGPLCFNLEFSGLPPTPKCVTHSAWLWQRIGSSFSPGVILLGGAGLF